MLIVNNLIAALVLLAFSCYGVYYTRTTKSEAFKQLDADKLVIAVCILGFFMGITLLLLSFG